MKNMNSSNSFLKNKSLYILFIVLRPKKYAEFPLKDNFRFRFERVYFISTFSVL